MDFIDSKLFSFGLAFVLLVGFLIMVTIPARWKVQGDLEKVEEELIELFKVHDQICKDGCENGLPASYREELGDAGGNFSKEEISICKDTCKHKKEFRKHAGLIFIYEKYPYMVNSRYYRYSSVLSCLAGLGGCAPAFVRERL